MPWCRIDKTYTIGEITIAPVRRRDSESGLAPSILETIHKILNGYKDIEGRPVSNFAILRYRDLDVLGDITEEQFQIMNENLQLACFAGLANRAYFNSLGPYCNADCFMPYGQKFSGSGFTAIVSRRRDGRTWDTRQLSSVTFSMPVHVSTVGQVILDKDLLSALVTFSTAADPEEWLRWQNAIACYNHANTDSEAVQHQVEWVLLASAFEQILNADSTAKDVAEQFTQAMLPSSPILAGTTKRRSEQWKDPEKPLRYEWMREFYRLRGDFAHGKLKPKQPAVWNAQEHLVLASITFPLIVRCLLNKAGQYTISDKDRAEINALESVADQQFMERLSDERHSGDSLWSRAVEEANWEITHEKAVEFLERKGFFKNGPQSEGLTGPK